MKLIILTALFVIASNCQAMTENDTPSALELARTTAKLAKKNPDKKYTGISLLLMAIEHKEITGSLRTVPYKFCRKQINAAKKAFKLADSSQESEPWWRGKFTIKEIEGHINIESYFTLARKNGANEVLTYNWFNLCWKISGLYDGVEYLEQDKFKFYFSSIKKAEDYLPILSLDAYLGRQTLTLAFLNEVYPMGIALNSNASAHNRGFFGPIDVARHDYVFGKNDLSHAGIFKSSIKRFKENRINNSVLKAMIEGFHLGLNTSDLSDSNAILDLIADNVHEDSWNMLNNKLKKDLPPVDVFKLIRNNLSSSKLEWHTKGYQAAYSTFISILYNNGVEKGSIKSLEDLNKYYSGFRTRSVELIIKGLEQDNNRPLSKLDF